MRTMKGTAAVALAAAGLAVLPVGASANGFSYGVTATEGTSTGALVWTRADKRATTLLEVSRDAKFGNKDDRRKRLKPKAGDDNTIQVRVGGLDPGHQYRYRFGQGTKKASVVGRFKTAPSANQNKT